MDINHGFHLTPSILRDSFQSTILDCQLYEGAGDTKMNKTGPTLAHLLILKIIKEKSLDNTRQESRKGYLPSQCLQAT